jgi:hypothetical protein
VNAIDSFTHACRALYAWVIFGILTSFLGAADPVVSNLSAVQRLGTKLVDLIEGVLPTVLS